MAKSFRVSHLTRNYSLNFDQVEKAIAKNSSFVWVTYGETFRDATIQEAANMRKEQAKLSEPLASMEIPGLIYQPTQANLAASRKGYALIRQAHAFAAAQ